AYVCATGVNDGRLVRRQRAVSRIHVLATGGTIASRGRDEGGAVAADSVGMLLRGLDNEYQLQFSDIMTVGSYRFGMREMRTIAEAVRDALAEGAAGVVVTHGTDTLEETAFLLELVHDSPVSVVLTGAQIP